MARGLDSLPGGAPKQQPAPQPAGAGETVEVPVAVLKQLQARLESLELRETARKEAAIAGRQDIVDSEYEAWKKEAGRPASERTQDIANAKYGTDGKRWRCQLKYRDANMPPEKAEKLIRITGVFPVELCANSDLEAGARYMEVMGINALSNELTVESKELAATA